MSYFSLPRQTEPQPVHRFRDCIRCNQQRPPEGGVEVGQSRWVCHKCWGKEVQRKVK